MTEIEFHGAMLPLVQRFGENKYPEVVTRILYAKFKALDSDVFIKCCNKLTACAKFAPLYNEFFSELGEKIREANERKISEIESKLKTKCTFCNNSGTISFIYEWGMAEMAGRCWCPMGEIRSSGLPLMKRETAVEGIAKAKSIVEEKAKEAESNIRARQKQKELLKIVRN